jgi:hypothetical protein
MKVELTPDERGVITHALRTAAANWKSLLLAADPDSVHLRAQMTALIARTTGIAHKLDQLEG